MEKLKKIDYMMLFKIVYLLDVLFAFNCFVFDLKIMKVLSGFVILFGIILIVSKLKNTKEIMHYRYMWIFLLFMISYIISVIINYPYGIVGNIKGGIWFGLQIILLYYISLKEPAKKIIKEMKIIFGMLIVYITICNLIGIIMMFLQYGGRRFLASGSFTLYGFVWGRLWGCYTDPNHGAVITTIAMVYSIYLLKQKNIYIKMILLLSLFINYLYIVFSDSRTGKVCFCVILGLYFFIKVFSRNRNYSKAKLIKQSVMFFGITLLFVCSFSGVKDFYNNVVNRIIVEETKENNMFELGERYIGREGDIEQDYSNRRFDIWKSGFEIFKENPVFGITFRNILSFTRTEMPETYIVNNDQGDFDSFHNVVVDVFVSQGIFGIILIVAMGILFGKYLIEEIFIGRKMDCEIRVTFLMVIALLVASMFISSIFYINSPETILFWMSLGYLVYLIENSELNAKNVEGK
ncbi:O-antigen ligase family protein [Blautia producta]|nr:O-antigen ligase family protein [Blautia producta]